MNPISDVLSLDGAIIDLQDFAGNADPHITLT